MDERRAHELPTTRRLVVPLVLAVTIIGTIAVGTSCVDHRAPRTIDAALMIASDAPFDAVDSPIDAPIDAPIDTPVDTPIA